MTRASHRAHRCFWVCLVCWLWLVAGCASSDPASSRHIGPSRLEVGPLTIGVWLPAGLEGLRLGPSDQDQLASIGINWIQWLQRATVDSATAEELAMDFCSLRGLGMPVYYEPPGFTPYDKLRNWATRDPVDADMPAAVAERVSALTTRWRGAAGLGGYLVGHEDYRQAYYPALELVVATLRQADPMQPAISVGKLQNYPAADRFFEALFQDGGVANIFQHEHYVLRADVPLQGQELQRRVDELVNGYDRVAGQVQDRYGRWHAIIQCHAESRNGELFYRQPTAAELRLQAGLALSRGAAGIIYFLYSSGPERVHNAQGEVVQLRQYTGLVNVDGRPTAAYTAARSVNSTLRGMALLLAPLRFHGAFGGGELPRAQPVLGAAADLEFGVFGDDQAITHVLVVNRRTSGPRQAELLVAAASLRDAVTQQELPLVRGQVTFQLEPGGFRLLQIFQEDQRE
jgi:hypothetical protein